MQIASRKSESAGPDHAAPDPVGHRLTPASKKAKLSVLLITCDDLLWPEIGAHLGNESSLKQVDSIDELRAATPSGQAAVVLWDARNQSDAVQGLSRLQAHSSRYAVVVLDDAGVPTWTNPLALGQILAHVAVPLRAEELTAALDHAYEEVGARAALLGDGSAETPAVAIIPKRIRWVPLSIILGVLLAGAGVFVVLRHGRIAVEAALPARPPSARNTPKPSVGADETIDQILENAQQAMLDRHFIDPADGSALALYRSALLLDADNGAAHQGLQRLVEILIARAKSALDERKFDVALQALETARNIDPADGRLSGLDARVAALRTEFGRDELRRRQQALDIENWVKLIDARLQQDKLIEPHNDSAAYYLNQARAAGASAATLQPQSQEIYKRLAQTLHAVIDQRRLADADRLLAELHTYGVPAATIASLQHDLTAARSQQVAPIPGESQAGAAHVTPPAASVVPLPTAASLGGPTALAAPNEPSKPASPGMPEILEASLTRVRAIDVDFPEAALRKKVEGWVDLSFVVTAEGKVTTLKVLGSSPAGVFETAATRALARTRYKPMTQDGKSIAISTKLRIVFRPSKPGSSA